MSKISRTGNAVLLLMVCAITSKILGFARELLIAYRYGAGNITDAFVLTNSIPCLIFVSLATAVNVNFIPLYHRLQSEKKRVEFTSNLTNVSVVILSFGCLVMDLFPKEVLHFFALGLPEETERYAIVMLRIVSFSILPIILSSLYQAYLQANESFSGTALCGIITNITMILFLFLASEEKYYLLSVGTVASHMIGLVLMICFVRKRTLFRYAPILRFRDPVLKQLVRLTIPLVLENLASSFSLIADRNLASFLDAGTISGLGYAGIIGNMASSMISGTIITVTFPMFSKLLADGSKDQFHCQFERFAAVLSLLLGPISIFMILNAGDIVSFIFAHGAFSGKSVTIVTESMICYAAGILPSGLQTYLIRAFYAMQDMKTPVRIKVFAFFCNIVLNLLSVRFLRHMGIALSTSVSYVIAYILLAHSLKKNHGIENMGTITMESGLSLLLSIVPAVILSLLFNRVILIPILFLKIAVEGIAFVGLYAAELFLLRRDRIGFVLEAVIARPDSNQQ